MDELPEGWIDCELGDFVTLRNGFAFKSEDYIDEGVPVVRISDIQDGFVTTENAARIDAKKAPQGFSLEKGDVLVAMSGATTGKIGRFISDEFALQNQRVGNLLPKVPDTDKSFIYYWINVHKKDIEERAYGGAQPNISSKLIESIPTKLPPLPEQKRIVARLDKLFAHHDKLKARLEKIPELLKQFRQAVLTQAVTGKLTEEWRGKNGYQNEWLKSTLAEVCSINPGHRGVEIDLDSNVSFLPMTRIQEETGILDLSESKKYRDVKQGFTKFIEGDVLFAKITPCMENGKIAIAKGLNNGIGFGTTELHVLRPKSDVIAKYVFYFILRCEFRDYCKSRFQGTSGHMRVPVGVFSEFDFLLPPLEEQKEIVRRVESLFALADKIEARYKFLKEKTDHLPQAILAKAFRGELVTQDKGELASIHQNN